MTSLATSATTLTGSYTLDPTHTRTGFVARHAMVTNDPTNSSALERRARDRRRTGQRQVVLEFEVSAIKNA